MTKSKIATIQIGKQCLTNGLFELLEKTFKNHELVKVSVLKSCTRNKNELKSLATTICSELKKIIKKDITFRIVGYTIFIRKWRKEIKK